MGLEEGDGAAADDPDGVSGVGGEAGEVLSCGWGEEGEGGVGDYGGEGAVVVEEKEAVWGGGVRGFDSYGEETLRRESGIHGLGLWRGQV